MATGKRSAATVKGPRRDAREFCAAATAPETIQASGEREFLYDGRRYTAADFKRENTWQIEFFEGEAEEVEILRCVHADRCQSVDVAKARGGKLFMLWSEAHPQLGTIDEFFTGRRKKRFEPSEFDRSEETLALWRNREKQFPYSHHALPLTRRQAFELIARFYLPPEFHRDSGITV